MTTISTQNKSLPASIKIGWKHYRVEEWPETDARDENRLGDVTYVKQRIRVVSSVSDCQRAETLLHEVLHATMDMWSLDVAEVSKVPNPEETLVTALSNGLSSVLRDNPALLAYLSDVWIRRPPEACEPGTT